MYSSELSVDDAEIIVRNTIEKLNILLLGHEILNDLLNELVREMVEEELKKRLYVDVMGGKRRKIYHMVQKGAEIKPYNPAEYDYQNPETWEDLNRREIEQNIITAIANSLSDEEEVFEVVSVEAESDESTDN